MIFKTAILEEEKAELDRLLWDILCRLLGLQRRIHQSFKLNSPQIDLIAVDSSIVMAVLWQIVFLQIKSRSAI